MNGIAVPVSENLYFDVARTVDELLDEQGTVAECRFGFAPAALESTGHCLGVGYRTHTSTATTGSRLEHDRIAEFGAESLGIASRVERRSAAGYGGDVERLGQRAGLDLVAEQP